VKHGSDPPAAPCGLVPWQIPGVKYVPLVGKVTVAMLERNLMRLFENYHLPDSPGKDFR
jgi:hypothetical protein